MLELIVLVFVNVVVRGIVIAIIATTWVAIIIIMIVVIVMIIAIIMIIVAWEIVFPTAGGTAGIACCIATQYRIR